MCVSVDCTDLDTESTFLLVREARAGCAGAVDEIYARYFGRLERWAQGRVPAEARDLVDTADIVQDALIGTLRHLDRFEPKHAGAFLGYARKAVRNKLEDHRRRASRRPPGDEPVEAIRDSRPSPLEEAAGREAIERYEHALEQLDPPEQDLVIARVELGMSYREIAQELGRASADAARMAVRRATLKLARLMGGG